MRFSYEHLSLKFSKLAAEYRSLGCESEALIAEQHARDLKRKLPAPRVVYVKRGHTGWWFGTPESVLSDGPFPNNSTAGEAAWAHVMASRELGKHGRLLAVVNAPLDDAGDGS